jgi:hypothetical protein
MYIAVTFAPASKFSASAPPAFGKPRITVPSAT